jgi:hypothetical protein
MILQREENKGVEFTGSGNPALRGRLTPFLWGGHKKSGNVPPVPGFPVSYPRFP